MGGGRSTPAARAWGVRSGQCGRSNTAAPTAIGVGEREDAVRSKARTLTTGGGVVTGATGPAGARDVGSSRSSGGVRRRDGTAPHVAQVALRAADPAGRGGPLTVSLPRTVARRRAHFRPPQRLENKPPRRAGPTLPRSGPPRAAAPAEPPRVPLRRSDSGTWVPNLAVARFGGTLTSPIECRLEIGGLAGPVDRATTSKHSDRHRMPDPALRQSKHDNNEVRYSKAEPLVGDALVFTEKFILQFSTTWPLSTRGSTSVNLTLLV